MDEPAHLNAVLASALLRITALPVDRSGPTRADLDPHDVAAARQYVRELVADPLVREAIAVSSPSLTRTLDALASGRPVEPKKLRRAVLSVTSYLLRMTTRPTPFGLLAGVAVASFGSRAEARLGTDHRKGVRADADWLAETVRRREADPGSVRNLRVTLNNLCTVRGDRLVLPYVPRPEGEAGQPLRELSVRHTPLVREAARLARRPIRFADLVDALCTAFASAAPEQVEPLLLQLIARRLLLTELAPPPSARDPLDHVLTRLPDDAELAGARQAIRAYAAEPVGAGLDAWREVVALGQPPQVDLAFDAGVTLPRSVAAEVERAARLLARRMPADPTPARLRHYHLDFLERYGTGQLVPLLELLDAASGMDAPAGYEMPVSSRPDPPAHLNNQGNQNGHADRERLLGSLAQQAVADDSTEVVLDTETLDRLAPEANDRTPAELELGVEVVADSVAALDAGDFQIVIGGLHSPRAGAIGGRFAYLLGDLVLGPPDPRGAVSAQVEYQPTLARSANVTRVPRQLAHTLTVGLFSDPSDPGVLGIDELLVGANEQRLYLWSERLGAEVVPTILHMLDSRWLAPNAVRFLHELAAATKGTCQPWTWGPAGELLPFLPRVRYDRIVLSPASWRLDSGSGLTDATLSDDVWRDRFEAWRKRWRVPAEAYLTVRDHHVGLDLDAPLHQALLRHELTRPQVDAHRLVEPPAGGRLGAGWLSGHAHELVVTLRSRQPDPVAAAPPVSDRTDRRRHYPGGEWVYAKLYAPEDRHHHLVAHSLDVLRAALPAGVDRWFFVRYHDPQPHLRVRLHGPYQEVLPLVHDWAGELCAAGLAQRLVLDTYEPEVPRYGGPAALEAAESAFHADSEAVIATLRLAGAPPIELLLATGFADLAAAYGDPDWRDWFLTAYPKDGSHSAFQAIRREALAAILEGKIDGNVNPALAEIWRIRAGAIRAYGDRVRALQPGGPSPLGSLLHMHHNRLAGVKPEVERAAYAIARGALQAQRDRERATR